ncbi:MAG: hypothetical protein ACRDMA_12120 [Solirubrobacterales bacterium]
MSSKRARGRSRRRRGSPKRARAARRPRRGPDLAPDPDRLAAELAAEIAGEARRTVGEVSDGLDAQLWASSLVSTWSFGPLLPPGLDPDEIFGVGLVKALEEAGDGPALAVLRALAAVGSERVAAASAEAAERTAQRGAPEPEWGSELGAARPGRAELMRDPVFDDGVSVMVEFERSGREPYTVGAFIDHNLGGLAKDLLVVGPLDEVARLLPEAPREPGEGSLEVRPIALEEAGARLREAQSRTERTIDPPVSEDFASLCAIVTAHARLLPEGSGAFDAEEISEAERDAAVDGFFDSPEGDRLRDDEDALDLAMMAVDFGSDYVEGAGRPLRWSPTVVELFMTGFLPSKALCGPEFVDRVPELLRGWVRYAGRARGLRDDSVVLAVSAVDEFVDEMRTAAGDRASWSPAKAFGMAAVDAGVDMTDEAAMQAFVDQWNKRLAA